MAEVASAKTPTKEELAEVIERLDKLYNDHKLQEVYEGFQPYKDLDNTEIQWRYSRVCYRIGTLCMHCIVISHALTRIPPYTLDLVYGLPAVSIMPGGT